MIQMPIRLPPDLHKNLRHLSFEMRVSCNKILIEALNKYMQEKGK